MRYNRVKIWYLWVFLDRWVKGIADQRNLATLHLNGFQKLTEVPLRFEWVAGWTFWIWERLKPLICKFCKELVVTLCFSSNSDINYCLLWLTQIWTQKSIIQSPSLVPSQFVPSLQFHYCKISNFFHLISFSIHFAIDAAKQKP